MLIRLELIYETKEFTVSRLLVDGRFECFTLEDEARTEKVHGETRIPAGRFRVQLRTEGGFHQRYAAKFGPDFHQGMLHVTDVPGFEWILFHLGNTPQDTAGCLLVGQQWNRAGWIGGSERAYRSFYPKAARKLARGEEVWLEVDRRAHA